MIDQLSLLPGYLVGHLKLSLTALFFGVLISVPLGIFASKFKNVERVSLGISGIIQTIPTLALLAMMVPLLGAFKLPSIGYIPALIALVLYSIMPILRNTVVGLRQVDPALIEAAKGVGMTKRQRLIRVELPIATPMIIAGIRTSTIWTVGAATLSTAVGAGSLGNYIFIGLQTRNNLSIMIGCISAALLSLILDLIIRALAYSVKTNRRSVVSVIMSLFAVFYGYLLVEAVNDYMKKDKVIIGAKAFTEQYILSEVMRNKIKHETGQVVEVHSSLASLMAFDALKTSDIDLYVEYSGTVWTYLMHQPSLPKDENDMSDQIEQFLKSQGICSLGPLGFDNKYVLAIPKKKAEALGINKISDLKRFHNLTIGGDYEIFGRPEWMRIKEAYSLHEAKELTLEHALLFKAANEHSVDVVVAYSTDGHIDASDLKILSDDKQVGLSYKALLLANMNFIKRSPAVIKSLQGILNAIDEDKMRNLNLLVDQKGLSPAQAAQNL